jgi:hypothetical protein
LNHKVAIGVVGQVKFFSPAADQKTNITSQKIASDGEGVVGQDQSLDWGYVKQGNKAQNILTYFLN